MPRQRRAEPAAPPLLAKLYGEGNVLCLRDMLLRLAGLSNEAAALPTALVQPHDHADYSCALLERTWCVLRPGAPPLRGGFTLSQASSQHQLVGRAVEALLRSGQQSKTQGAGGGNVLCYGFRKRRPTAGGRSALGMVNAESFHHNSTTASLCSPSWQLLLSRIGDTLMLYLLLHASMFAALPNACCLQLSGPPISQVARAWRKEAPAAVAAAATRLLGGAAGGAGGAGGRAGIAAAADGAPEAAGAQAAGQVVLTQQPSGASLAAQLAAEPQATELGAGEGVAAAGDGLAGAQQQQQQSKKALRPSSWQRRRAARLRAEQEAAAAGQQMDVEAPQVQQPSVAEQAGDGLEEEVLPATQEIDADMSLGSANAPASAAGQGGPAARVGAAAAVQSSWPARMPRPTDMLLQRSSIFYCASFPRSPGLTAQHMLTALRGVKQGERALYAAIFDAKHNPVGRAGACYGAVHSTVPPTAQRVPAKHRHLLLLLKRMIERTQRCPFGTLLQRHCPLPPQLREEQQRRRREQAAAAGIGGAGGAGARGGTRGLAAPAAQPAARPAAAGRAPLAPLPSQATLLQLVRQRQQPQGQGAAAPPASADALMDELFLAEQQGQPGRGQESPPLAHQPPPSAAAAQQQQAQGGPVAAGALTMDQLMDELAALEQQQQQQEKQHRQLGQQRQHGAKVQRPAEPAPAGQAAAGAAGALAAAGANQGAAPGREAAAAQPEQAAGAEPAAQPAFDPASLASCFVPHRRVVAFVWAAVRCIVPAALLGDPRCRRVLRGAISRFVSLRRYEQMSVHQAMQGLRLSGLPWLQPPAPAPGDVAAAEPPQGQQQRGLGACPTQHAAQQRMVALWIGWLFAVLVAPLLRAHFYCTESEAYRQQVFYYRKPVWAALARGATEELQQRQFAALSDREALGILQARKLGVARLRLLPKRTGMRFIVNLGRSSTVRFPGEAQRAGVGAKRRQRAPAVKLTFRPVNSLLQNVYQVLRFEASCQPEMMGASVLSYNDAFCRLQPFLRKWRAAAQVAGGGAGGALQPYIVSLDVTRAFDHVRVPLLLSLVEPLLRHEAYLVLKYTEVVPSLGQVKVLHRRLASAAPAGEEGAPPFPQLAQRWAAAHKGKAFTDQVVYERVTRQQALLLLRQHLTANLVRLRRKWCAQSMGIAQGSTLSTLLCSLYLAHLERTQLASLLSSQVPAPSRPRPQQQQQSAALLGAGGPAAASLGGSTPACTPAAAPATVVCLSEGDAAALCPATVYSLAATPRDGGLSSGSKGLLTELAKAADSMVTGSTPQHTHTHVASAQAPQSVRRHGGGGSGSSVGDLLLLPAGARPAGSAAAAAAAAAAGTAPGVPGLASVGGGAASAPPSPMPSPKPSAGSQAAALRQLGCSRLALHAGSVLLRLVDDFLLITAVPAVARGFAARMLEGFESHNVAVNPDKTKLSFALQLAAEGGRASGQPPATMPATVWRSGDGSTFVKWCGLLVNTASLELQGDYTRYCGEHISTSLTLPLRKQPGAQLATRLCHYLRPKIHPLLLDATVNSPQTVRLNVYQAFLLAAMKFHCYVAALPAAPAPGAGVMLEAITSGIGFMSTLTRHQCVASAHQQGLEVACSTRVPEAHVRWLGLRAFLHVLRRKQTRYGELLAQLQELADAPALRSAARQLAPVVEPARSSVFDAILY